MTLGENLTLLLLAFARISSFLFLLPILNGRVIPSMAKLTLAAGVAMAAIGKMQPVSIDNTFELIAQLVTQIIIGIVLAKLVELLLTIPKMAGAIVDMDMGFSMSQIMDPASNQQTTVISTMFNIFFVTIFIYLDGIQKLILTLVRSFELTANLSFLGNGQFLSFILGVFAYMFASAIQIALPIMGSMFIVNFTLMIIGKSAPQTQIFQNMFAIKLTLGILFLVVLTPLLGDWFVALSDDITEQYITFLEYLFEKQP